MPPRDTTTTTAITARVPPPKTKRDSTTAASSRGPATSPPLAQLRQLAPILGNAQDRGYELGRAAKIVRQSVESAPQDGIGPTSELFDALWNDTINGLSLADRRQLLRRLLTDLFSSDHIGLLVERDTPFLQSVLTALTRSASVLHPNDKTEVERYELAGILIESLATKTRPGWLLIDEHLDFVAFALNIAVKTLIFPNLVIYRHPPANYLTAKLAALDKNAPSVAVAFVDAYWDTHPSDLGPELVKWIINTVPAKEWNAPGKDLAARLLNLLWTAGEYDLICQLITAGIDCTASAKAWGVARREGVHTGYVQPLTHLLGKYVKPIALLSTRATMTPTERAKVEGAQRVVAAINGLTKRPEIVLDFTKIQSCQLVKSFETGPGWIWGFEDVRLPYILAARATAYGQRPLRMLDMWTAVGTVVSVKDYEALVTKPTETIAKAIQYGEAVLTNEIRSHPEWHDGIKPTFMLEFRHMCTDFLHFFAKSRPYGAYLAPPEQSGKDTSKRISTYACTIGLHWSAARGLPVYYCLDGLNMQDVVNYKRYKVKEINAYLSALDTSDERLLRHGPFMEVITLAEVREILRHWEQLGKVIHFVKQGTMMTKDEADRFVTKWRAELDAAEAGLTRNWSKQTTFDQDVLQLANDRQLWSQVGTVDRWKCLKEQNAMELAARDPLDVELLVRVLKHHCPTLRRLGLVPDAFVAFFEAAATAKAGQLVVPPDLLRDLWQAQLAVCDGLRGHLAHAIAVHFGPRPKAAQPGSRGPDQHHT